MQRTLLTDLIEWKNQATRMPLLLRGARQVGKTFLIEKFGQSEFENLITINLEQQPEYKDCVNYPPLKQRASNIKQPLA